MRQPEYDLVLTSLRQLADHRIQERLWLGSNRVEQSSFEEAVEGLFSDSGLGVLLEQQETGFGPIIEEKLRALRRKAHEMITCTTTEALITSGAMEVVRSISSEILNTLAQQRSIEYGDPDSSGFPT